MVLAHTFSTWYWTFDKTNLPFFTLTTAVVQTTRYDYLFFWNIYRLCTKCWWMFVLVVFRYHLGTVALGSMIITIGQIVCYVIRTLMNNRYTRVFNLCCNISEIVQRLLQFLNKNTFIMVAIHGNPFCQSMRDAFNLLMRNIASVYVTSRITSLQFAIFNITIASGMGGLTYLFLPKDDPHPEMLMYPVMISVVASFIVSATFFGVYQMAIDTLFLCFCKYITFILIKTHYESYLTLCVNFLSHSSGRLWTKWWNWTTAILHVRIVNESTS